MSKGGYPDGFYSQFSSLSDVASRYRKARKIIFLLMQIKKELGQLDCLDVGCSSGLITSSIQPFFRRMVGLDYDIDGINAITESQRQPSLFIRGDAMQLPFPGDFFGAIICAQVYEHVPNDIVLFSEIERITQQGAAIYFSGPNKMFPIEPHYFLPFLHWLPGRLADGYLRLFRKGEIYDIRSRTFWELKKILKNFEIFDMTIPLLRFYEDNNHSFVWTLMNYFRRAPVIFWKLLIPFIPNFNWILVKPLDSNNKGKYHVLV